MYMPGDNETLCDGRQPHPWPDKMPMKSAKVAKATVDFLPPRLGKFRLHTGRAGEGGRYIAPDGQIVILSYQVEADGRTWAHLSTSYPDRLPTYEELCSAKAMFMGGEQKAIQVFAPESEHCNVHPFCLHLWACLDGDPLPDFRGPGGIV